MKNKVALGLTMLWATCPPRPAPGAELLRPEPSRRRRGKLDLELGRLDPGWCLARGRRLLNGGFAQLREDAPRLLSTLGQACILRRTTNGTVPLVVLARGLDPATVDVLCDAGVVLLDADRTFGSNPRDSWTGVTADEARRQKRTVSGRVQDRPDGALTYYKFAAFRLGCFFDSLIQVDLDATVLQDPRPWARAHAAITSSGGIVGEEENALRGYVGLRTHLMLLRPSEVVFQSLLAKARTGDHAVMTNTDQDARGAASTSPSDPTERTAAPQVLESYFCPSPRVYVGRRDPPNRLPDEDQPQDGPCDVDRAGRRGFRRVHPNASRIYRENALVDDLGHMHLRGGYRHPLLVQEKCQTASRAAAIHCRACFPISRGTSHAWARRSLAPGSLAHNISRRPGPLS